MQENNESHFEQRSAHCREIVMGFITKHGRVGREQLLDAVFRTFDRAISELVRSGKIVVEEAPNRESHLDMFIATEPRGP
jgi:hypothetical protein